ncbi:MAG: FKBP-type peptidyl-prolyl cis-trans isomerase [Chitinispirillales bacterium]|jgi:FKBP-type peptidyl-prolyl cis-trans isomerase|nr:FKBP-type peptidyl-prolyl cis-trans isomerase [Chitinispirillales bacterium]
MKKYFVVHALALSISLPLVSCSSDGQTVPAKVNLSDEKHQVSYMIGRDIGRSLKGIDADLDLQIVLAAIRETMNDIPSQLSDSALSAINMRLNQELREKSEQKRVKQLEENKLEGENFLKANKQQPGVIETESGLQYQIITEGSGAVPTANDKVKVHYHGTLINGTVFDSSVDRGEPVTFDVTGVIKGWTEVLKLMKTGSKYKVFIPSALAYGERGARPPIGPNTMLIFEIELLEVVN